MADQDPIIREDSLYKIVEGPSWQDAQANAEALGGNLVVINNQNEFENLLNDFSDYVDPTPSWEGNKSVVYIGVSDHKQEGSWEWINNAQSEWNITWGNSNPDNQGQKEHYGILYLAILHLIGLKVGSMMLIWEASNSMG